MNAPSPESGRPQHSGGSPGGDVVVPDSQLCPRIDLVTMVTGACV